MNNDIIIRSFARLESLKSNIPQEGSSVPEKYVNEYHDILKLLSKSTSIVLDEFFVPINQLKYKRIPVNIRSGEFKSSDERYCDRNLLMMKLDGIINYFTIKNSVDSGKLNIGFNLK